MADGLVIVGAGQAGFALAAKLRTLKDMRPITMIGTEAELPYQRPPLSKKYLLGEMSFDRLLFRPPEWYADNRIEVRLSTWVERIDRATRQVVTQDGSVFGYETLALATGARPRRLPASVGGDLGGVYTMRDRRDADRLAGEMRAGRRLLVIGGGYIGLEAAAVACQLGLEVTVIEIAERILGRVAARETAGIIRAIHERHDVVVREATGLVRLLDVAGRVAGAELSDSSVIGVDIVIAGMGVSPNDGLAKEAGLDVANGIVVNDFARTSDPAIFAIGDCAVLPWKGARVRLESVQNAVDQAEAAAAVMAGAVDAYRPNPWFWSDQYDIKLQIAGFNLGYDETILRPGTHAGSASVWYFAAGKFIAVDAVNDAKAYVIGKKLLEADINPDKTVIADPAADLKRLLG